MRIGTIGARRTEAASQRVGRGDEVVVRFRRGPEPPTAVAAGTGARGRTGCEAAERYALCGLLAGFCSAAKPPSSDADVEKDQRASIRARLKGGPR
jgi:hypothetical protein